jgi:hypothetical protein
MLDCGREGATVDGSGGTGSGTLTVTVAECKRVPSVAVIVVDPAAMPRRTPAAVTVAILGFALVQVACAVMSLVEPSGAMPRAESWSVAPASTEAGSGVTVRATYVTTWNDDVETAVPPAVTMEITPPVAPEGIVTTSWVADAEITVATALPMRTMSSLASGSKFVPAIVTIVPVRPLSGEKFVMVGGAK